MTSAADFNLFSWKNFFLLSAVVAGVLIPVGLRYYFKREVASVATVEDPDLLEELPQDNEDVVLAVGSVPLPKKHSSPPLRSIYVNKGNTFYADEQVEQDEDIEDDEDDDEDVILEAGPAIVIKLQDGSSSGSATH